MSNLLIVPHQDDEIFCYSYLDKLKKMIIVFEGGGEPINNTMDRIDLFYARCDETIKTAREFGINDVEFLRVSRPYKGWELNKAIEKVFKNDYGFVITTMEEDLHPDHKALSVAVKKYCKKDLYGFIVHTNSLDYYTEKIKPDISVKLSDKEFKHKIRLANNYVTQKHFLPNVIRRKSYKWERYWRLN